MKTRVVRTIGVCIPALVAATTSLAQTVVLSTDTDTMVSVKGSSSTAFQDVRPLQNALQRGVNLDGTLRAASLQGWSVAGNTIGGGAGAGRVGDVRLDTGAYSPNVVDIALPAPGFSWVVGRTYNHRQESAPVYPSTTPTPRDSNGYQGKNWFQTSQPEIVLYDADGNAGTKQAADVLYVVYGADRFIELARTAANADTFRAKNGAAGVAVFAVNPGDQPTTYTYTDQQGTQVTFLGFDANAGSAAGQLWKIVDAAGNAAYVGDSTLSDATAMTGYFNGRVAEAFDSADRRYSYTYTSIDSVYRLTQIKVETKTSGTWSSPSGVVEVAKVDYAYYQTGDNTNGDNGNLKLVTVTTPLSDSGVSSVRKTHYRYWTGAYNASTNPGYANHVKFVIDPEGYRRADWVDSNLGDDDPLTLDMSVSGNKAYASAYFEYDTDHKVRSVWQNGQCGCGGGSINGVHTLTYDDSSSLATYLGNSTYDAGWARRATVVMPDGSARTQYFDEVGQALSTVQFDADPAGSPSIKRVHHVGRNSVGVIDTTYVPSRNDTYTHSTGSITALTSSGTGAKGTSLLIASGDLTSLSEGKTVQDAGSGSSNYVNRNAYTNRTYLTGTGSGIGVARPFLDTAASYPVATTNVSDSTRLETTIAYTWYSATDTNVLYLVPKTITVTNPVVSTGNNGSNSATTSKRYMRTDGTTAFTEDADGTFNYSKFTNGQLTKQIVDCQTNHGSDFASGDDPNTNFGVTESGNGLHLVTTYTYDAQGRPDTTTLPDGRITKMYYSKLADGRLVTISIPRMATGGSTTYYGPVSYSISNFAGKSEAGGTVAISSSGITTALSSWIDETDADPITALDVGTLASLSTSLYDESGSRTTESRSYHTIPGSGAGSSGTNYDATVISYDSEGRPYKTTSPSGTITKKTYDSLGRPVATYVGTVDGGGSDNMVKVDEVEYDDNAGKASGLVTKRTQYVVNGTTNRRDTLYTYDARDRMVLTQSPTAPHTFVKYDNLGRVVASGQFSSVASIAATTDDPTTETTNRIGLSETVYDEMGRVWKSISHNIDVADGSDDDNLVSLTWYDADGRVIKTKGPSGIQKTAYDRIGRAINRFVIADDGGETSYSAMDDVSGDKVMEQSITHYGNTDTALTGKVQMSATISRWHDDTSGTGALDTNADSDANKFTESDIDGRINISVAWMDELGRVSATAQYGTNGMIESGSNHFTFASGGPLTYLSVPTRSNTVLVTTTTYDTAGRVVETEAPGLAGSTSGTTGIKTRYVFDAMGRRTAEIRNYTGASTPITTADRDTDLFTRYTYANGLRTKYWVDLDGDGTEDSDDQVTIYTYGTTNGGSAGESAIATGHLLFKEQYPDSSGGTDVIQHAYNAQSQETWRKDQLGCIIETTYDLAGRQTVRNATDLGSGSNLNGDVRRVEMAYTSRGQVDTVTQYDATSSGNVTDQVQYGYDNWGNLTDFDQDVDSAIGVSGRAAFNVDYAFTKATPANGATTLRRTSMTYPGSVVLDYTYSSASGSLDDITSRVTSLAWNASSGTTLVQYKYLGMGQVVRTDYPQPDAFTSAYASGSPHAYGYLDTFGRVTRSHWTNGRTNGTSFYDTTIAYDRLSNILSTDDGVMYGTNAKNWADVLYGLDSLGRLTDADEGELASGSITGRKRREMWKDGSTLKLSQTGNWLQRKLDKNGDGDYTDWEELNDTATFNKANEWLTRDLDSTSGTTGDNYALTHDADGNLTNDGKSYKYVYDAFGRMVEVKNQSNTTLAKYRYNGLGYRIMWQYDANSNGSLATSERYYFAYDERWRMLMTYRDQDSNPKERFVYHAAGMGGFGGSSYIDLTVLRDRDANTAWTSAADSTMEERTYLCQNWRADVVAAVDAGTTYGLYVMQRMKYDSYGAPRLHGIADYTGETWVDISDLSDFANDYGISNARADINFDDVVNSDDEDRFYFAWGAGGPTTGLRKLYAGYEWDPISAYGSGPGWYHVRNRVLLAETGRWSRRDPIGYVDGENLFEYVQSRSVTKSDPSGLLSCASAGKTTAKFGKGYIPIVQPPCDPDPSQAPCKFDTTDSTCKSLCDTAYRNQIPAPWGITDYMRTICCICTFNISNPPPPLVPPSKPSLDIIYKCVNAHELCHMNQRGYRFPAPCYESQCYQAELSCLADSLSECQLTDDPHSCMSSVLDRIRDVQNLMQRNDIQCRRALAPRPAPQPVTPVVPLPRPR
jgi:RHS repeat-associated protein